MERENKPTKENNKRDIRMKNEVNTGKRKTKNIAIITVAIALLAITAIIIGFLYNSNRKTYNKIVELSDLYGDIKPYGSAMLGDKEIQSRVYEGLLEIDNNFSIQPALAKVVEINPLSITVEMNDSYFQLSDGSKVKCTADSVIGYYTNTLLPLQSSKSLENPGIANLSGLGSEKPGIEKVSNNQIKFSFSIGSPDNVLALTESIGYLQSNGIYAGTKDSVVKLDDNKWQVGKTLYQPLDATQALAGNERLVDMVTANILPKADNLKYEAVLNGAYGFLTWTKDSKVDMDKRSELMSKLEKVGIRDGIKNPADSIYSNTSLYKEAKPLNGDTSIEVESPIRIGIIDMGSFREVRDSIESAFTKLGIPFRIEVLPGSDLLNSDGFDMVYVRLSRGKSPDITNLLSSDGLIGKAGYSSIYENDVKAIRSEVDWEARNNLLSELDNKLREDGVWLFMDAAFNIKVHK